MDVPGGDEPSLQVLMSKVGAKKLPVNNDDLLYLAGYAQRDAVLKYLLDAIRAAGNEKKVVVKFVLVDLAYWRECSTLQWFVKRMIATEDELVHSALEVGPHLIHWSDKSLVHVKNLESLDALLAYDVAVLDLTTAEGGQTLRKLAEVIVEWNTTKHYNKQRCNSHDFVNQAINAIGSQTLEAGAIGEYMNNLRLGGTMTFHQTTFNTHKQLDRFCRENPKILDNKQDKALLKAFDRAFWLRHNHQSNYTDRAFWNPDWLPEQCCFGDPSVSGSFPVSFPAAVSPALGAFPQPPTDTNLPPIRVLCMDGGGMRGVMLVEMLRQIEQHTGKQFAELFDLVAGTSTGGILSAALATNTVDIEGADKLYRTLGSQVFGYQPGLLTKGAIQTLKKQGYFDGQKLRHIIKESLGEANRDLDTFHSQTPKMFVVAATKRGEQTTLRPFIFRSYPAPAAQQQTSQYYEGTDTGLGIALSQALLATSAAPYYFPSITIEGQEFVDGGVVANDPSEIALLEAMRIWPGRRINLLSLGTGCPTATTRSEPALSAWFFLLRPVQPIVEPFLEMVAATLDPEVTHRKVAQWVQAMPEKIAYERLNTPYPVLGMTACTEKDINKMIHATKAYMTPDRLDAVAQLLSSAYDS